MSVNKAEEIERSISEANYLKKKYEFAFIFFNNL